MCSRLSFSVLFQRLVRLGRLPACWRKANVTLIPKGPPSSSVANYRLNSINQYCQKCLGVWYRFVSDDSWNALVYFQPPSLHIGKVWVPAMHYCACPNILQSALESLQEASIMHIDSAQHLIWSTIWEFYVSSVLWVLGVLCCQQ